MFNRGLTLLIFAVSLQAKALIREVAVVTPVYRELLNLNLARFLLSAVRQDAVPGLKRVLVFVVNDEGSTSSAVRAENSITLSYLRALAQGHLSPLGLPPEIERAHREAGEALLGSNWRLRVIDATNSPHKQSIGELRDIGNADAMKNLDDEALKVTLLAQMDADCILPAAYLVRMVREFDEHSQLGFVQFGLENLIDDESPPRVTRRAIRSQLGLAAHDLRTQLAGELPLSGTPRTVLRASAFKRVGHFPWEAYAEDRALITRLREENIFGKFVPDVRVGNRVRGRPDGFDAATLFSQRMRRVGFPQAIAPVLDSLRWLFGHWAAFHPQAVRYFSARFRLRSDEHLRQMRVRREALRHRLLHPEVRPSYSDDPFLRNAWLPRYLAGKLRRSGSVEAELGSIARDFPNVANLDLTDESRWMTFALAASDTLVRQENEREHHFQTPNPPQSMGDATDVLVLAAFQVVFEAGRHRDEQLARGLFRVVRLTAEELALTKAEPLLQAAEALLPEGKAPSELRAEARQLIFQNLGKRFARAEFRRVTLPAWMTEFRTELWRECQDNLLGKKSG